MGSELASRKSSELHRRFRCIEQTLKCRSSFWPHLKKFGRKWLFTFLCIERPPIGNQLITHTMQSSITAHVRDVGRAQGAHNDVRIRICDPFDELSPQTVQPNRLHRAAGAVGLMKGNTECSFHTVTPESAQPQKSHTARLCENNGVSR
jgi:hypothetical protein